MPNLKYWDAAANAWRIVAVGQKGDPGPTGPTGPTGPAGTSGGGYKGPWDAGTGYPAGSLVLHNGGLFAAANGAVPGTVPATDQATVWTYLGETADPFIVLGKTEPVPPGTPAGTVILRKEV
jgi:hypothetical protein